MRELEGVNPFLIARGRKIRRLAMGGLSLNVVEIGLFTAKEFNPWRN